MIPIPNFEGGWSYTNKEMSDLFKHISFKETISVLEFGSGDSTVKIYNHIKNHYANSVIFYTYESKPDYMKIDDDIFFNFYDEDNIDEVVLPDIKFDIILIDGPNGDKRSLWYSKIRENVKSGTILLIDDFNHYKCFSDELDKNFIYELLSFSDIQWAPGAEHSWKIVSILGLN